MTTSWEPEVLPHDEPIRTYCQRFQVMNRETGLRYYDIGRLHIQRLTNARALHNMKVYFSATIIDPENKTSYIVFERLRGDLKIDPPLIPISPNHLHNFPPQILLFPPSQLLLGQLQPDQ